MAIEDDIKQSIKMQPRQRAVLNILHSASLMENHINSFLAPLDLTHQQYNILRILKGNKADSMSVLDIQSRMIDRTSNVSRLVEKLRKRGFVERRENLEDRRRVDVSLSKEGAKMVTIVQTKMNDRQRKEDEFSEQDADLLNDLLDRFKSYFIDEYTH